MLTLKTQHPIMYARQNATAHKALVAVVVAPAAVAVAAAPVVAAVTASK